MLLKYLSMLHRDGINIHQQVSPHVLIAEVWGLYDLGDLRVGGIVGDRDLLTTLSDLCCGGSGVHDGDS